MSGHPRVIVALDFPGEKQALEFVARLDPGLCRLKVGFELYVVAGPQLVERLQRQGFDVFLDLKFHDIPNTVASVCRAACQLGVWMLNVHASGGARMMSAACEAVAAQRHQPHLIAVTVLTSMESADLQQVGIGISPAEQVLGLAKLAQASGIEGVVCSAQEAKMLRDACGAGFLLVTPGIRQQSGTISDDQRRTMTPDEAIRSGSNYLVIGRPVTSAHDPMKVLTEICVSLPPGNC